MVESSIEIPLDQLDSEVSWASERTSKRSVMLQKPQSDPNKSEEKENLNIET